MGHTRTRLSALQLATGRDQTGIRGGRVRKSDVEVLDETILTSATFVLPEVLRKRS